MTWSSPKPKKSINYKNVGNVHIWSPSTSNCWHYISNSVIAYDYIFIFILLSPMVYRNTKCTIM